MRYKVELRRVETKTISRVAKDIRAAVSDLFAGAHAAGFGVESVTPCCENGETLLVIGRCENCAAVLLEVDRYGVTEDGCILCKDCGQAATKDQ